MDKSLSTAVQLHITVAGEPFSGLLARDKGVTSIGVSWENDNGHQLKMSSLAESLGLDLPSCLNYALELERAVVVYELESKKLGLKVQEKGGAYLLAAACLEQKWFSLRFTKEFSLQAGSLPVVGPYLAGSNFTFHSIQLLYQTGGGLSAQIRLSLALAGKAYKLGDEKAALPQEEVGQSGAVLVEAVKKSPVNWKEINKKIGPCFVRRVGVSFEDGTARLYVDGDISISILTFSLLELYMGVKLGDPMQFSWGLKGLMVSLDKPPLTLSGGLYKQGDLYNGSLTLKFKQFSLTALGSYGKEKKSGKDSFFAFVMLDYAFGGPPCFYITGLAAGFGVNRRILLPQLKEVESFPFIAAVRGKHARIRPDSSVAEVLEHLSDVIEPCEDLYFLTAGVRFTSFGMVESVAIVNIAFGKKLECSLLGISEISIPPGSGNPIAYGCLNLRAVFAPEDGILLMEGALSDHTYLLSRDCRVSGGFAFYSWFSGEYAGDFVITVGGYAPGYDRGHYPAVDRVKVCWIINKNLDIKGEAYFALASNGLMAGGRLELNFRMGKLRAWCCAYADFFIRFKPFYYEIGIGVSVGISYRLDFLFIHHTFSLEMGADLCLWGPEFAGIAHVKWHILSFTIRFNTGGSKPALLTYPEFAADFLPDYGGGIQGEQLEGEKRARLLIEDGLLGTAREVRQGREVTVYYVEGGSLSMKVETAMPIEQLRVNGEETSCGPVCGILPMGLKELHGRLEVTLSGDGGASFTGRPLLKNLPRAVWDTGVPDQQADLMRDCWMGCVLCPKEEAVRWLPKVYDNTRDWYELDTLLRSEEEKKRVRLKAFAPIENRCEDREVVEVLKDTLPENKDRDKWLEQLTEYRVRMPGDILLERFVKGREHFLNAPFELRTLGYRGRYYETKS